jgi:hypothetical protein
LMKLGEVFFLQLVTKVWSHFDFFFFLVVSLPRSIHILSIQFFLMLLPQFVCILVFAKGVKAW